MAEQTALAERPSLELTNVSPPLAAPSRATRQMTLATWRMISEQSMVLEAAGKGTGILPKGITNRYQIAAVVMKGYELGLSPMYSLEQIGLVNGKPVVQSQGLTAIIQAAHGAGAIRPIERTNEHAIVEMRRDGQEPCRFQWTMADAQKAGLANKTGPWSQYPRAMLYWRAVAEGARVYFADTIAGLYLPEEMGVPVTVSPSGDIVIDYDALPASDATLPAQRSVDTETGEIIEEANGALFASSNGTDGVVMQSQESMTFSLDDEDSDDVADGVARTGPGATEKPATANQLATIEKLARLLGRDIDMNCDRTTTEASDTITDLSRAYNEMRGNRARGSA